MLLKGPKVMTSMEYHVKQLEYNAKAQEFAIKEAFPNLLEIDYNNPEVKQLIRNMASNPIHGGGLAEMFGIADDIYTLDMHRDLSHGYVRADKLPEGSPLLRQVIDTPRGKMLKFRSTSTPINKKGEYVVDPKITNRQSTEFLFTMGSNTSASLARLAIDDPTIDLRFRNLTEKIFKEHVVPSMLFDAEIRKGADGKDIEYAKEILFTSFMHDESRALTPFKHFHFDLMNVALGYDDKLHTLSTDKIVANIHKHKAVFMTQMKEAMEKEFGFVFDPVYFQVDLDNSNLQNEDLNIVSYDVSDSFVPDNVKEFMKARTKEIEDHIKAQGKELTPIEKEYARLETRDDKSDLSPSELKALWKSDFEKLAWTSNDVKKNLKFSQTRKNDNKLSNDQLMMNWERKIHYTAMEKLDALQKKFLKGDKQPSDEVLIDNFIRKHKEVSFTEDQFKAHLRIQLIETCDGDFAERESERIFTEQCVHMLEKTSQIQKDSDINLLSKADYYKDFLNEKIEDPYLRQQMQIRYSRDMRFTTKGILEKERYISESLMARKDETKFTFDKQKVSEFILSFENKKSEQFIIKNPDAKPFKFAKGQRQAVLDILTKNSALINVSGRAGAGKSTLLECVRDFYLQEDIKLIGTSTSSTATEELANATGMKKGEYHNATKLIILMNNDKFKLTDKSVLVVDEAGMLATEDLYKLVKKVNEAGAKLILCGEKEQLQSVNFGSSFRILGDHFGFTAVNQINRQKEQWQKEMVEDFAMGRSKDAIRTLYDKGYVAITDTEKERADMLVQDYLNCTHYEEKSVPAYDEKGKIVMKIEKVLVSTPFKERLAIAATNNDVENLNNLIRERLIENKQLQPDEATIVCRDKVERGFSTGDRVIFIKNTKSDDKDPMEVNNAQKGEVLGFTNDKTTGEPKAIRIRMDNGNELSLNLDGANAPAIRHSYVVTTHKSQGSTVNNSFYYVSANLNSLHQAYVAMSRHRFGAKMYLSKEMQDEMCDRMEGKPPTASMLKVALWRAKELKETLTPEITESFNKVRGYLNKVYQKFDDVLVQPHATDLFSSLAESMAKTQYKKSTYDFEVLDGTAVGAYQEVLQNRKEILAGRRQAIQRKEEESYVPEYAREGNLKSLNDIPHIETSKIIDKAIEQAKETIRKEEVKVSEEVKKEIKKEVEKEVQKEVIKKVLKKEETTRNR